MEQSSAPENELRARLKIDIWAELSVAFFLYLSFLSSNLFFILNPFFSSFSFFAVLFPLPSREFPREKERKEEFREARSPVKAFALKLRNFGRKFARFELSGKPRRSISSTFPILLLLWASLVLSASSFFFPAAFLVLLFTYFRPAGHVRPPGVPPPGSQEIPRFILLSKQVSGRFLN